jgi:hypothetical protein
MNSLAPWLVSSLTATMSTSGNESSTAGPGNTRKRGKEDEDKIILPIIRIQKEDEQPQETKIRGVAGVVQRGVAELREILSQHQLLDDNMDFSIWDILKGCDEIIFGLTRRATTLECFGTLLKPLDDDTLLKTLPGNL